VPSSNDQRPLVSHRPKEKDKRLKKTEWWKAEVSKGRRGGEGK
jgi:hypothetical protein